MGQFVDSFLVEVEQLQMGEDGVEFGEVGGVGVEQALDFGQFVAGREVVLVVLFFVYAASEN